MPKQEYNILGFHGGINDHSDAKDIRDIELRAADGVSVHRIGKLVSLGNKDSALTNLSGASADIEPGYGLYFFSTDYNNSESNVSEDWLSIYNKTTDKVRFYYRNKNGGTSDFTSSGNEVDMSPSQLVILITLYFGKIVAVILKIITTYINGKKATKKLNL